MRLAEGQMLWRGGHLAGQATKPRGDSGSGARRVGVVLGLEGRHGGGVDLATGRHRLGQALKVPFEAGRGGELSLLHGEHDRALQDIDGVVQLVVHVHGWVGAVGVDSALHDAEAPLGVAGHRLEGHGVGPEDPGPRRSLDSS
jgi:hypothetical protein